MSENEIKEIFKIIQEHYKKYLKNDEVKPINLQDKSGKFTKDALTLCYLAQNYPNTKAISKNDLTSFVRQFYPDTTDVQQARHLAKQKGYYIISGTRGDIGQKIEAGHYQPTESSNIIPQCQVCNRPDRDRWIYDKTGRVVAIADSEDGKRVVEKYLKKVGQSTREYFLEFLQKLLGKKPQIVPK